ncbi:MAG: glycogen-binding domain-containing protein [Lentisphaeria bacterium]|nr:glycogen-binding domain-containing protein [Lentisphaeria bacterium]
MAKCSKTSSGRRMVTLEVQDTPGRDVRVPGSFNEWQPVKKLTDKNHSGIYRCRLMLAPGEYQYKFCIDGEWRADAANPNFVPNDFGSLNSVLIVQDK